MHYDVFNGDADGIIALLQLRLAQPKETTLVTGVKRDIQLLDKVSPQPGDSVTVLDISMEKNRAALESLLDGGVSVFYADHHRAGDIPGHPLLDAHINLDANMCTALIVDQWLDGRFHFWAITAAFGDNLIATAQQLATQAGLDDKQAAQLQELGTLINYNGYGAKIEDLHYHPAALFNTLLAYDDPFAVIADKHSPYWQLKAAYHADMERALSVEASYRSPTLSVFELPDEPAARRISGVYGNALANQSPHSAHAVLTQNPDGTFLVSLRAPLNNKHGAGAICSAFATGGGREGAAGINALPANQLATFIEQVEAYYQPR